MSAVDALLDRLPPTTLIVGKGGVGKTTCAAALALHASRRAPTTVITTDPARALPTVLRQQLTANPTPIAYAERLMGQVLDAGTLRERFMQQWGDVIRTILDRGTYLDESDIGPLVDTALPGSDEIFSALELARILSQRPAGSFLFVDTAPTGHTLRLLALPRTFRAVLGLLEAMQAKHRFMVRTLTRTYKADRADAFLRELDSLVGTLEATLSDAARCFAIVVTNPEPVVVEETRRLIDALRKQPVHVAALIWNAVDASQPLPTLGDMTQYVVPRLQESPTGKQGLARWLDELRPADEAALPRPPSGRPAKPAAVPRSGHADVTRLLRPLTVVAGKGGVGKTTVSAALALRAARQGRTLVVSTDPAPSLADALGQAVPDADTPVDAVENLFARQMDATAAFGRLRAEYQSRVDALFDGLIARGVDLAHDRAIARDLLSLAPPGVDEVYALSLLSDALFRDNYRCVVVDPAPTGHLLRLLEMPQLALAWSHQLLRLMLKYKEVVGLGETAAEVLDFARSLRAVDARLRDTTQSAVVLVTLDEPVVLEETERLAREVRARGVALSGVVRNRARGSSPPLPVPDAPVHFEAPAVQPPPTGAPALGKWIDSWVAARKTSSA